MRNIAKLIKDKKDNIFLKVYDKTMKHPSYFPIHPIGEKRKIVETEISDVFSVNLKEE